MADEVILLDFWACLFGMRCRIALEEKGIEYEYNEVDPFKAKSSLLLQSNPIYKSVPVFIHNGKPICESLVILQYIDEEWSDKAPLMPSDPYSRAHARLWIDFVDKKLCPFGTKLYTKNGEDQEVAKEGFIESLEVLEEELGDKSFFSGEAFGFLDLAIVPYYSWFHTFEKLGNFSIESETPKLIAWAKRCLERGTVSKTLPDSEEVYDFVLKLRKINGIE